MTLQTRIHEYFEHFNFVIFVDFITFIGILSLYVINVGVVNLFADSSFLIYNNFKFILFDVFYRFESMKVSKKINQILRISVKTYNRSI